MIVENELIQVWSVYFFNSKPITKLENATDSDNSTQSLSLVNITEEFNDEDGAESRFRCLRSPLNYWNFRAGRVRIPAVLYIDKSGLDKMVNSSSGGSTSNRPQLQRCSVVLLYADWCRFSAAVAAPFNALARAFPQLDFVAVSVSGSGSALQPDLATEMRWAVHTGYVPRIKLYHGSRAVAEFTGSTPAAQNDLQQQQDMLDQLTDFVFRTTGQMPAIQPRVSAEDLQGPVPTEERYSHSGRMLLIFCWITSVVCVLYLMLTTDTGLHCLTRLFRR